MSELAADHARAAEDENFHGRLTGVRHSSPERSPRLPQRDVARLGPAKALDGGAARLVLAADPAVIAAGVDLGEQPAIVEIAHVGLAAVGGIGDLVVAGEGGVLLHGDGHVAVLDLPVIDVKLQAEAWFAHLVNDGACL